MVYCAPAAHAARPIRENPFLIGKVIALLHLLLVLLLHTGALPTPICRR
jgi:hypothetical protein